MAREAIDAFAVGWRNKKTPAVWENFLFVHAGALRDIPIGKVGTDDVLNVLRPIWVKHPVAADNVRQALARVFD